MQSLMSLDGHQPDAIRVADDVNQAMFDVLTPQPIEPARYDLALMPQRDWQASGEDWSAQLIAIFQAVRRRYPVLAQQPSPQDAMATLMLPLSGTHQLIVGRIFAPCLRNGNTLLTRPGHANAWRQRPGDGPERSTMPNRLQIDFDVHRAMVQTLVPHRIAEDAYSIGLKPSSYTACRDHWASDLSDIRGTLRCKYARLDAADVKATAAVTYDQPLANTKDRIVEEILEAGVWFPRG